MTTAIHQPNFLPWIGYFQKISQVDKFVFFDDVQFERGKTFTSRSKILIQGKAAWLTIPVKKKSDIIYIKDIKVDSSIWKKKHLKTINLNYSNSPFFDEVFDLINSVYSSNSEYLIDYNIPLITVISKYLNFDVNFIKSSQIIEQNSVNKGLEKLISILLTSGSDKYLSGSGSGSMRYVDENVFLKNNIKIEWQQFDIKPYPQFSTNVFIPGLSILDLLFNCGPESINYL